MILTLRKVPLYEYQHMTNSSYGLGCCTAAIFCAEHLGKNMDVSKKERGEWLEKTLDARGTPRYGRAAYICKKLGCSNAVTAGWLRGSLPQDLKLAMNFCTEFQINLRNWVYLDGDSDFNAENGGIPAERLLFTIKMVREYERDHPDISDEQYAWLMQRLANTESPNQALQDIAEVIDIFGSRNGTQ